MTKFAFNVLITTAQDTGDVMSAYFQVRKGKTSETREFADGAAFADYNRYGELLGVELLAPCKVSIVDQLAEHETASMRKQTKRFMKNSGPRQLIAV